MAGLFADNDDDQIAAALAHPDEDVEVIPLTQDQQIAIFLNRWCHRALGDRAAAEAELRALLHSAGERTE